MAPYSSATFASAAGSFAELVRHVPTDAWGRHGLGDWDVRSLVGHASRSLITVSTYLQTPAEREDIATPQEYYARVSPSVLGIDPADVAERGRKAGRDLGDDPAASVAALVAQALADVQSAGDPVIAVIGGLGIRLHAYLPTRTFELVVHSMDIARALDLSYTPPADALEDALVLAARIAAGADGATVLMALTGRDTLPPAFSIV